MYNIIEQVVPIDDFLRLRDVTGLEPRPRAAAEKGLPHTLYGMHVITDDKVIAMGRVVGDGGLNFEVVDVAVDPDYQGNGLGRKIMEHIMDYLEREAPTGAYITLMADVPELYQKFGFKFGSPETEGMYIVKS